MIDPLDDAAGEDEEPTWGITILRLDQELLGISVLDVQEVISIEGVTRLFRMPPHLLGLINLRGHVLPVAHLGTLLDLASGEGNRAIVVRPRAPDGAQAAFLVDEVVGIRWVRPGALMDVPGSVEENRRVFFRALLPDRPAAMLLRTEQLFQPQYWCPR